MCKYFIYKKELLEEKMKKLKLGVDGIMEKAQQNVLNIMGPFSRVWLASEGAIASEENQQEIILEEMVQCIEQAIMLVGQNINALTYHHQVLALLAVMSDRGKTKSIIKEQKGLLEKVDSILFGSSFRKHVVETTRAKKESEERQ